MGGVVASTAGETSLPGLLALGEAACTGVHGANRLASNSLLEGLVFGLDAADRLSRAGLWAAVQPPPSRPANKAAIPADHLPALADSLDYIDLWFRLRRAMSRHVAVVRDAEGLAAARSEIAEVAELLPEPEDRGARELRDAVLAAAAITTAATRREESRGAHFRADFPDRNPALASRHLVFGGAEGRWRFASLTDARGEAVTAV